MNMRQELIRLALDSGSGGGSDITVAELKVEENGTYEKEGYAFSPVIVDVPTEAPTFTDLSYFYYQGARLNDLPYSQLDTSNVTNMSSMFYFCNSLTSLDLTGWDTNKVTAMSNFIYGCRALNDIYIRDSELRFDGKLKFKLPTSSVFNQIRTNNGHIHLSATLQSEYETATNWTAYTDIMLFDLP